MRDVVSLVWVATSALLVGVGAIHLVDRGANPAVVGMDIQRKPISDHVEHDRRRLRRRQEPKAFNVGLDNMGSLYFVNATLGTPPQPLRLHIDTGSSDLWANSASSEQCGLQPELCELSGTYNANDSSTYRYVSSDFRILYVDESFAIGDYAADTFNIGGIDLAELQFGIGYNSTSPEGVLGIGYAHSEAQVVQGLDGPYRNLPELMVYYERIKSNAYSLWLNDLDASTGSILFGGVNADKYVGQLHTLPVESSDRGSRPSDFFITLTEIGFSGGEQPAQVMAEDLKVPVLLDSGTSLTYLPNDLARQVMRSVGAEYNARTHNALVACSLADNRTTLDFTFTSVVISVPMDEMVIPLRSRRRGSSGSTSITLSDGETPACLFGIAAANENSNVLGDTFLRSAYVVYDLANDEISLAQTNFNATTDRLLEIATGPESVPDSDPVADPVSAEWPNRRRVPPPPQATLEPTGGSKPGEDPPQSTSSSTTSSSAPSIMSHVPLHILCALFFIIMISSSSIVFI